MTHPNPTTSTHAPPTAPPRKLRRFLRFIGITFIAVVLVVCCVRPFLPKAVRWYVNRTLNRNLLYEGRIGDVTLNLWRGAYSISDIRITKRLSEVPQPLLKLNRLELAIQWNAILHRKIVGQVVMDRPELNFVDSSDDSESQTGAGEPWLATLEALFPFKLNSVQIHDGSVHFRAYKQATPVDVYLDHMEATVDDLTNVRDRTVPMLTTVQARALAMDQADFQLNMKLDPFSYYPTFHMAARLLGLDVTTTNALVRTYGQFEFKSGLFDLVIAADASEGQVQGYVKPLFRNLRVFNFKQDLKQDNPLQFFWQALIGATTGILKNQPRDQFGTLIPFTGDLTTPNMSILTAVANVLRNGFIRAYLPRLENGTQSFDGMEFKPASLDVPTSIGDDQ